MSHRNTPNRRSHLDISPPSIKGPNLLLPPGLDLDSYSTIDTLPRPEASESDQRAAINRENELYSSLANSKPSYFKSTSIEADLLTSSTPRTVQKTKVIISRGHRSKTVTRLHGSEQNILSNSGLKPTPSANAVDSVSEVKQQHNPEIPEIRITFEEKKVEGKSFVGDFLAERRRPIAQFSPLIRVNGQESPVRIVAQEENEPKTIPCNEQIDTENIAKSLFEKYHKEIPITEKDVLLPTFGFTSSPRQPVEDEEEAKSIKKMPTRLLQNNSRTPLKVRFLPAVDVKISAPKELPEVKTTKALHRSPTNLLPPNLSNVETKHRRYNTQIKERKPQLDINPPNLSKDSSQPEIPGAHVLAKTLERVQHLGNRTAINKELAFRQKVRGNYEFDFPRERTVQRVMAPDPKAYVNNLMKKALAKRSDRFLFKMTQDKEEVVAEEIILDLDATKEKSIPKVQPLTEKKP